MNDLVITNKNLREYTCESSIKTFENFIMETFENIQKLTEYLLPTQITI